MTKRYNELEQPPAVHRITRSEFHALAELLDDDHRHELFEGTIYEMTPPGFPHARTHARLLTQLGPQLKTDVVELYSGGIIIDELTELWPDLCLVRSAATETLHAESVPLVIEVAVSSLERDRKEKAHAYVHGGVREVWVIDVLGKQIFSFVSDITEPFAVKERVISGLWISPSELREVKISPTALFAD
jgi:Uma2 family endonuclease